jgi:hypothetical protein
LKGYGAFLMYKLCGAQVDIPELERDRQLPTTETLQVKETLFPVSHVSLFMHFLLCAFQSLFFDKFKCIL